MRELRKTTKELYHPKLLTNSWISTKYKGFLSPPPTEHMLLSYDFRLKNQQKINGDFEMISRNLNNDMTLSISPNNFKKNHNKVETNILWTANKDFENKCVFKRRRKMIGATRETYIPHSCSNFNSHSSETKEGRLFIVGQKEDHVDFQKSLKKNYKSYGLNHEDQRTKFRSKCDKLKIRELEQIYPKYKILELHSLYKSILQFADNDPNKLMHAFESSLIYNKIMIKPEIIKKCLFESNKFDFNGFVHTYKKMEDLMFIQRIIDYVEIMFEAYSGCPMDFKLIYTILMKRSYHDKALEITNIVFSKLCRDKNRTVLLEEIVDFCERDHEFCSCFARLYYEQQQYGITRNKIRF